MQQRSCIRKKSSLVKSTFISCWCWVWGTKLPKANPTINQQLPSYSLHISDSAYWEHTLHCELNLTSLSICCWLSMFIFYFYSNHLPTPTFCLSISFIDNRQCMQNIFPAIALVGQPGTPLELIKLIIKLISMPTHFILSFSIKLWVPQKCYHIQEAPTR